MGRFEKRIQATSPYRLITTSSKAPPRSPCCSASPENASRMPTAELSSGTSGPRDTPPTRTPGSEAAAKPPNNDGEATPQHDVRLQHRSTAISPITTDFAQPTTGA